MSDRIQSAAAAAKALQAALAGEIEPVPPEWFTREDYQSARGLGEAQANKELRTMIAKGIARTEKFPVLKNGARRTVPHYRLKK